MRNFLMSILLVLGLLTQAQIWNEERRSWDATDDNDKQVNNDINQLPNTSSVKSPEDEDKLYGFGELGYNLSFNQPIGNMYRSNNGHGYPGFFGHEFRYSYHFGVDANVMPFIGANIFLSTNNRSQIDIPAGDYRLNNRMYSYHAKLGFLFLSEQSKIQPYIFGFYGIMTHRIRDEIYILNDFGFAEVYPGELKNETYSRSGSYGLSLGFKGAINSFMTFDMGVTWYGGNRDHSYLARNLDLRTEYDESYFGNQRLEYNDARSVANFISINVGFAFRFSSTGSTSTYSGGGGYYPQNQHYHSPHNNSWWGGRQGWGNSGWGNSGWGGGYGQPGAVYGNPYANPYRAPRPVISSPNTGGNAGSRTGGSGNRSGGGVKYQGRTPIGRN